jgi:UDP-N-acetylglucosamine transferase subunit ALG13
MLEPKEFYETLVSASLVISHAGMGSIISAIELGKPIIVVPRQAALGEHRNDHQLATARSLRKSSRVTVALDETELVEKLRQLDSIVVPTGPRALASAELIHSIRDAIHQPETPRRRFWLWHRASTKSREALR